MVDEEDVVTTATKGGQHKEVLDRITGQRFNLVKVVKAREEEGTSSGLKQKWGCSKRGRRFLRRRCDGLAGG